MTENVFLAMTPEEATDLIGVRVRVVLGSGQMLDGTMQRPDGDRLKMSVEMQNQDGTRDSATATIPCALVAWYLSYGRISTGIMPLVGLTQ